MFRWSYICLQCVLILYTLPAPTLLKSILHLLCPIPSPLVSGLLLLLLWLWLYNSPRPVCDVQTRVCSRQLEHTCLPGVPFLKKIDSPLPQKRSAVNSSLNRAECWWSPPPIWTADWFHLAWSCQVVIAAVCSWVWQACHDQKTLFYPQLPKPLALRIFLPHLSVILPEPCGEGCDTVVLVMAEHSTYTYFLHLNQFPALITIHCTKLLWWDLRLTLVYGYRDT